jgi:integrase
MATIRKRKYPSGTRWQWILPPSLGRKSGSCPTRKCAEDCAKRAEAEIRTGKGPERATLAEAIERYEALYLPSIPDSAELYRRHLRFWRAELGEKALVEIDASLVSGGKLKLAGAITRYGRPIAPATVNRYLITLSSLFSWAISPEIKLVARNPVADVEKLKEPPKRVRYLSRPVDEAGSELVRLLDACSRSSSRILFDVVALLLTTGCRAGEIMGLSRRDIRLEERGFVITAERAKTEKPRFVPLSGLGLEVVRRRVEVPRIDSAYLFPNRRGKPSCFPRKAWVSALAEAGIKDMRPHDLRHTFASYLAMEGHSLPEIMAALGHKTTEAMMRYAHLADAHQSQVSEGINRKITEWTQGITRGRDRH